MIMHMQDVLKLNFFSNQVTSLRPNIDSEAPLIC
jgi:hypothetical protein